VKSAVNSYWETASHCLGSLLEVKPLPAGWFRSSRWVSNRCSFGAGEKSKAGLAVLPSSSNEDYHWHESCNSVPCSYEYMQEWYLPPFPGTMARCLPVILPSPRRTSIVVVMCRQLLLLFSYLKQTHSDFKLSSLAYQFILD
jgi:hypothetical protein